MTNRFLRVNQIIGNLQANPPIQPIIPISKTTLYDWMKKGFFPAPVYLGDNIPVWSSDVVEKWMRSAPQQREQGITR
ncbi:MAG: AlpA family phage regulatory protein [Rhodocyclaceae bacterium]|nr:AlpA family phage regulatory protein [Rhodocyclaceae bacterium]